MDVLAKGQLSYMILSCLSERDMYGLELIDEIKARYDVEVKLPSLYSNINRMKELKYIYSYLKESTKGPKCSYSSITELGRTEFEKLKEEFEHLKASHTEPVKEKPVEEKPVEEKNAFEDAILSSSPETEPIEEEEEDYSDFFNLDGDSEETAEKTEALPQEESDEEEQPAEEPEPEEEMPIAEEIEKEPEEPEKAEEGPLSPAEPEYEVNILQNQTDEMPPLMAVVDEQKQEDNEDVSEYNQRLYAVAKDFSKNKNKRSYSENQIELALSTAVNRSEEEKQQDLQELKSALISSRQGHYEELNIPAKPAAEQQPAPVNEEKKDIEQPKDDGRFITDRIDEQDIPKPKRIEPARLNVTLPNYDKSLPAPKRNISVDPTVKDVKAKLESLYAKAETKKETPQVVTTNGTTETYEDLKTYYKSQDVEFKVYERPAKRPKHNTNLLKLYVSLFIFALVGVGSGIMYMIFSLCKLTTATTNFVYYLFPIIALVYVVYCFYNYKTMVSRVPNKLWHPAIVWSVFALLVVAIFLINYACGVPFNQVSTYFSTILVPIFACACGTVGLYYSTLFALKKFWK